MKTPTRPGSSSRGGKPTRLQSVLSKLIETLIVKISEADAKDLPLKDSIGLLSNSMKMYQAETGTPLEPDFDESTATRDEIIAHRAKQNR